MNLLSMYCNKLIRRYINSINQDNLNNISKYDIVIVGGGPVGLITSLLLSKYGINHILLEKRKEPTHHPQAHFINARTMEILRCNFPSIFFETIKSSPSSDYWRDFVYCYSMIGRTFERYDHFADSNAKLLWDNTPSNVIHLPQNKFELILRSHVNKSDKNISTICYESEVTNINDNVDETIVSYKTNDIITQIKCKYVIACDGSNSFIRNNLNIKMIGNKALQTLLNVYFTCKGLHNHLKPRPAMLYFVFNETMVAVFVGHDPMKDEWVCQIPIFPPYQSLQDYSNEKLLSMISDGLGITTIHNLHINIISTNVWTMYAQIAEKYTNRHNNIFLAGDSAHRFPPAGGFGMNSGIQDSYNLTWKLANVLTIKSNKSLLLSYEQERREIAETYTRFSLTNYNKSTKIAQLLGVDPNLANSLVNTFNYLPMSFDYKKKLVNQSLNLGLQSLKWLNNSNYYLSEFRVNSVKSFISRGESLPLLFPNEDLGYKYGSGLIQQNDRFVNDISFGFSIGRSIPHCWFTINISNDSNIYNPLTVNNESNNAVVALSSIDISTFLIQFKNKSLPLITLLVNQKDSYIWFNELSNKNILNLFQIVFISAGNSNTNHDLLQQSLQSPNYQTDKSRNHSYLSLHLLNNLNGYSYDLLSDINIYNLVDISGRWQSLLSKLSFIPDIIVIRPDNHIAMIDNFDQLYHNKDKFTSIRHYIDNITKLFHIN